MKKLIFLAVLLLPYLSYGNALKTYTVAGDSMSPVLASGDNVVVNTEIDEPAERGDLVAIKFKNTATPMVKRVVAVEGDRVEIKNNTIIINEKSFRHIDEKRWQSTVNQLKRYSWIVPSNNFFVLGDNPQNSRDSRRLGLISTSQLIGKVVKIITSVPQE